MRFDGEMCDGDTISLGKRDTLVATDKWIIHFVKVPANGA